MAKSEYFMFKWLLYSDCLLGPEVLRGDGYQVEWGLGVWPVGGEMMANVQREAQLTVCSKIAVKSGWKTTFLYFVWVEEALNFTLTGRDRLIVGQIVRWGIYSGPN